MESNIPPDLEYLTKCSIYSLDVWSDAWKFVKGHEEEAYIWKQVIDLYNKLQANPVMSATSIMSALNARR